MDKKDFVFPMQNGPGCFSSENGWKDIDDWFALANTLPTIKDELKTLPRPKDMRKTVYVIHLPPAGLGLDICMDENRLFQKLSMNFF